MQVMPVTINEVAAKAGVSKSTVSCYLNEKFEAMSPETRARIAAVIAELDYRPNALARSLKQKRTHTIAAIVANILNPFSTTIIRGAEDCCQKAGMNLILCNADDKPDKEKEYIEMLLAKQVDGLIINTTGSNNALIREVCAHTPVVLIDRKAPEAACDTIAVNGRDGSRQAVDHLVKLGHRRIAMFTLPYRNISPREDRVLGFQEALARHGLEFDPELLIETEAAEDRIAFHMRALVARGILRPTAVFGANNLVTMAIIKALKALNIAVPRDMAVIGFDDWDWAALIDPPVTVVAQPAYEMGAKAAAVLIKRLTAGKAARKPAVVTYKPQLIVRKSCGET
ncbi:MAG: LacI family transcriptional regulator [Negativicutes bacterium]|nr:LacI family transcriptional regulator [Negativicutes bacterium]